MRPKAAAAAKRIGLTVIELGLCADVTLFNLFVVLSSEDLP